VTDDDWPQVEVQLIARLAHHEGLRT
jgi:hypothetical protein